MVFPIGFALALILTGLARPLANRTGLVDVPAPTPLKLHSAPVPVLGGAAVVIASLVTAWLFDLVEGAVVFALVAALIIGIADDRRPAPVAARVALLAGTGLMAALLLPTPVDAVTALIMTVSLLVVTNGVNLLDGQNGLAAGTSMIAAAGMAGVSGDWNGFEVALAAALCGFLVWNFPNARIFLGNGGAYAAGAGLAALAALIVVREGPSSVGPLALCLAVPVGEVLSTIARRSALGVGMSGGDRFHGYDLLAARIGRTASTLAFWAGGAVVAGTAVLWRRSPTQAAVASGLVFAASTAAGYIVGRRLRAGSDA